jgi:hypothetical protein
VPNSPVLQWVEDGFQPKFINDRPPPPTYLPLRPTSKEDATWLELEEAKLLRLGVLRTLEEGQQRWESPAAVVRGSSKPRMIVDISALNKELEPAPSFRMPSLHELAFSSVANLTSVSMAKYDITKMFYHVPLHPDFQPWTAFRSPSGRLLCFRALPMGLQQSPWVACKVLAPLVHLARQRAPPSTTITQYMDDALLLASPAEAPLASQTYAQTLTDYGWLLSAEKSLPTPVPHLDFLGHHLKSTPLGLRVELLNSRRVALAHHLRALLSVTRPPSAKRLAQTVGEVSAATLVIPLARSLLRPLRTDLGLATPTLASWRSPAPVPLSASSRTSITALLQLLKDKPQLHAFLRAPTTPALVLTTDASMEFGWGATVHQAPTLSLDPAAQPSHTAQDRWPPSVSPRPPPATLVVQRLSATQPPPAPLMRLAALHDELWPPESAPPLHHITARETLALLFGLLAHRHHLVGRPFSIRSDCTTTIAAVIRSSSASPAINHLSRLLALAFKALQPLASTPPPISHVAGVENTHADQASRAWLPDCRRLEWPCRSEAFTATWTALTDKPPPRSTIDAFASSGNAKTPRFWSYKPDPLALATDALAQPWRDKTLWLNPPWQLLDQVVLKALLDRPRQTVLLTPDWPGAPWFKALEISARRSIELHPAWVIESGATTNLAEPLHNPRWMLRAWAL